jgi:hypothetical protein
MLEFFFFFLLIAILFSFQPFTSSVFVPSEIRVPLLLLFTFLTIIFSIKKKKVFYFLLAGGIVFIGLTYIWLRSSPQSLSDIVYVIVLIIFTFCLYHFLKRAPKLFWMICMFWLLLLFVISAFSIASFVAFNFHLAAYKETIISDYDYYYNPILGYINLKDFETTSWGRACYFLLEPSYLAFFLTTNFFFINSFPVNPALKFAARFIVFAGAMSAVSTGSWVVFGLIFGITVVYWVFKRVVRNKRLTNIIIYSLIAGIVLLIIYLPKDQLINLLGTSSYSDRENRVGESLLILGGSDISHLLLGSSPAYLEKVFGKGESDQFFKLLVEEGIIVTIFVIAFVVYCTKKNFKFMMAVIIFLNSVVMLWTPLFCINIILCRILTETENIVNYKTIE